MRMLQMDAGQPLHRGLDRRCSVLRYRDQRQGCLREICHRQGAEERWSAAACWEDLVHRHGSGCSRLQVGGGECATVCWARGQDQCRCVEASAECRLQHFPERQGILQCQVARGGQVCEYLIGKRWGHWMSQMRKPVLTFNLGTIFGLLC